MASVFDKVVRPKPAQLRTVSDRRYADAEVLRDTGANRHANGAMYLGGIALECLLKAKAIEAHPELARAASSDALRKELRPLWFLVFRFHELDTLLSRLPTIELGIRKRAGETEAARLMKTLRRLCGVWTIHVRYSPRQATHRDADEFLQGIEELRRWLK